MHGRPPHFPSSVVIRFRRSLFILEDYLLGWGLASVAVSESHAQSQSTPPRAVAQALLPVLKVSSTRGTRKHRQECLCDLGQIVSTARPAFGLALAGCCAD